MTENTAAPDSPEGEVTNTLDEDLRAALLAATADDNEEEEVATDSPDDEGGEDAAPDDEAEAEGEVEPEAEAEDEDSDTPDQDDEDEPGEAITPPIHWSEGDKEAFNALPEEGKQFILRRHKAMEADYTRKTTEIAPLRKVLEPFKGEMERLGMTEVQAAEHLSSSARQLWQYQQALQQNPEATLKAIAQQYGVDLGGNNKRDDGAYVDPEIAQLSQQVTALQTERQREIQQRQQEQQATINRQLSEFQESHPYFDDLKKTMGSLMYTGEVSTLEEAYERASWSHPEIRQKMLQDAEAEKERKARESRKAKVKRAKSAGTAVTTKSAGKPTAEKPTSLAEDLLAEARRQMNG